MLTLVGLYFRSFIEAEFVHGDHDEDPESREPGGSVQVQEIRKRKRQLAHIFERLKYQTPAVASSSFLESP